MSVVMSVYNGLPYLDAAIASILSQNYANLEFVFIDDGSIDGSQDVLQHFARQDDRIRLIRQSNTGLTRALNRGIAEARGLYIARMDADDLSLPGRIARQVRELEADPAVVAASCFVQHIGSGGDARDTARRRCAPELVRWHLLFFNYIGSHSQVLFRKSAFDRVGGYDESFVFSQDYDLWWRMSRLGPIAVIDEVLHQCRVGHGSISTTRHDAQLAFSLDIARRNCEEIGGPRLDRDELLALRRFWNPGYGPPLSLDEMACVAPLLRDLHRAFANSPDRPVTLRNELRDTVALRWMFWGQAISLSRPRAVARSLSEAVRWSPHLLPAVSRQTARRLAASTARAARA